LIIVNVIFKLKLIAMDTQKKRADDLVAEADKLLSSWSLLRSKTEKHEDASGLYKQAGNIYKTEKMYDKAIDAFQKALVSFTVLKDDHERKYILIEKAKLYRLKGECDNAVEHYKNAIDVVNSTGSTDGSGKLWQEIADTFEKNLKESEEKGDDEHVIGKKVDNVVEAYKKASEMYALADRDVSANEALIKASNICINYDRYTDALECMDTSLARLASGSKTLWTVNQLISKCVLCCLVCNDFVKSEEKLNRYRSMFDKFGNSTDDDAVKAVLQSVKDSDRGSFIELQKRYRSQIRNDIYTEKIVAEILGLYFNGEPDETNQHNTHTGSSRGKGSKIVEDEPEDLT
ncbi:hypothetical protein YASMINEVIRUS_117, partial [Yasminevirus sp. GU-2018]